MQWSHNKHMNQRLEKENKQLRKELAEAQFRIEELERELHFSAPVLTNDPEEDRRRFDSPFYPGWYSRPRSGRGLREAQIRLDSVEVSYDAIRSLLNLSVE